MPKSIHQARAAARLFFVDLLEHEDWRVFSQIRTKDHDTLPAVLTRDQVIQLLSHIRLRRYRTTLKLIYACARLSLDPKALRAAGALGSRHCLPHAPEQGPVEGGCSESCGKNLPETWLGPLPRRMALLHPALDIRSF